MANCKQKPIYTGKMGQKCQAHNLKVVGSNPTPATNYSIKSISYKILKNIVFGVFLCLKPDNDYRVANKVANSRQVYSPFYRLRFNKIKNLIIITYGYKIMKVQSLHLNL